MSTDEIIQGTIALQTFAANAKYVEMIVDVAFVVVPTILGFGAAGLIGSAAIKTAKDVMNSISVLQNLGYGLRYGVDTGVMAGKGMAQLGLAAGKGLNRLRRKYAERWQQSEKWYFRLIGKGIVLDQLIKSKWTKRKRNNQDTKGKQEEQGSGGGGGNPPTPPDTKSDKKDEEKKQ